MKAIRAERDENSFREPLTPTEAVEIGKRLEALEKPKAKERQRKAGPKSGKGKKTGSGNLPEPVTGDTRDKVAAALGMGGRTYEKAKQVAEAAEQEPEKFGDLPAKMDAVSVDAAHKEMKSRRAKPSMEPEPAPEAPDDEDDEPPVAYMLRTAMLRRDLTSSQKATLAMELDRVLAPLARERQRAALIKGNKTRHQESKVPELIPEPSQPTGTR